MYIYSKEWDSWLFSLLNILWLLCRLSASCEGPLSWERYWQTLEDRVCSSSELLAGGPLLFASFLSERESVGIGEPSWDPGAHGLGRRYSGLFMPPAPTGSRRKARSPELWPLRRTVSMETMQTQVCARPNTEYALTNICLDAIQALWTASLFNYQAAWNRCLLGSL